MICPIDDSAILSWGATRTPIQDLTNIEVGLFDGTGCKRGGNAGPQQSPVFSRIGVRTFYMLDKIKHKLMDALTFNRNSTQGEDS